MGAKSRIEWTDATWTPIRARRRDNGKIGVHCERVSEARKDGARLRWWFTEDAGRELKREEVRIDRFVSNEPWTVDQWIERIDDAMKGGEK